MRILRFNETNNPETELLIKRALFWSGDGSGYYQLCGSLDNNVPNEIENAKNISNTRFSMFSFTMGSSIKKVEPYTDSNTIIWVNGWGNLMSINSTTGKYYEEVNVDKFDEYYSMVEKFPDWKMELLPYFIANSKKEFVIDFFERLENNTVPCTKWHRTLTPDIPTVEDVISYVQSSEVYDAYNKLRKYISSEYQFAKYFSDISEDDRNNASNMNKTGF